MKEKKKKMRDNNSKNFSLSLFKIHWEIYVSTGTPVVRMAVAHHHSVARIIQSAKISLAKVEVKWSECTARHIQIHGNKIYLFSIIIVGYFIKWNLQRHDAAVCIKCVWILWNTCSNEINFKQWTLKQWTRCPHCKYTSLCCFLGRPITMSVSERHSQTSLKRN